MDENLEYGFHKGEDELLLAYLKNRFQKSPFFTALVHQVGISVMKEMDGNREEFLKIMNEWWGE